MTSGSEPLSLDQAIRTAIVYETNVRNLYREAEGKATDDIGRRIFRTLAEEEQGHLDYLNHCSKEWEETGKLTPRELTTILPSRELIAEGVAKLRRSAPSDRDWSIELKLLERARELESETGAFYRKMVSELDAEGRRLFEPFLEIEDAHYDLVQAEIDALNGTGFWFDTMEFQMESG